MTPNRKFKNVDDLPLENIKKRYVLAWFAWKFYDILLKLNIEDRYCKSYDPLLIEDDEYHMYISVNEMVKILKEENIH